MNKLIFTALLATGACFNIGCKSPHYADRGAGLGALSGAAIGAAVGENNGNALAGALVGTAVGAVAGGAIGQSIDDDLARERAQIQAKIGHQLAGAVTVPNVIEMNHSGVGDPVMVAYIQKTGLANKLHATDIQTLKQQGVSDTVITAMINAPLATQQVSYQAPAPAPRPIVVEERVYVRPNYCAPRYHRHRHYRDPGLHLGFHFD